MVEQRRRAVFNWSGGKDSALALQTVLREDRYEVVSLLTTVDASNDSSSMHGIPAELLRMQADSIGLPIRIVPTGKGIEDYERAMAEAVGDFVARGAEHFIFGDIFLQDVRAYRERQLEPYGVTVVEPLWGQGPERIMAAFLASGLETVVVTTDASCLGADWIGRTIDGTFRDDLPDGVDPCGENGEYHTFCHGGRNVPLSDSVPFGRACPSELHGDARRRCGEVLRLLVRCSDGSLDRSIFLSVR